MADIIDIKKAAADRDVPPVSYKKRDYFRPNPCNHRRHIEVSREERRVYCRDCKVELDPIQVIIDIADGYFKLDYKLRQIEEMERKRLERNRKARERRAKQKAKREKKT